MTQRKLIVGNWKMNGLTKEAFALAEAVAAGAGPNSMANSYVVGIAPPAVFISEIAAILKDERGKSAVLLGGQDCHTNVSGAHTGDISAAMLADVGGKFAIVGHSERRQDHGESDALVRAKAQAAHDAGLLAIVCVGESEAERDAGNAADVILRQLTGSLPDGISPGDTVIAYEPIWAIGTGRTPSLEQIAEIHLVIWNWLEQNAPQEEQPFGDFEILYGGSVKPGNAREILSLDHVGGALVGGASLKVEDFLAICAACE